MRWDLMLEPIFVKQAHLYVSFTAEILRQKLAPCFVPRGCIVNTYRGGINNHFCNNINCPKLIPMSQRTIVAIEKNDEKVTSDPPARIFLNFIF